ncbi:MAG: DUF3800 domain-containing protein [Candidatus Aadella gelida]|nr:DUF3800 domain-containing protein [Candidatus Aadella gelida]
MWFLYLDESGDLGFDFVNKNPSKYFTITVIAVSDRRRNKSLLNAVKKTLKRKLNSKKNKKRVIKELKGVKTTFFIKKYFFDQIKDIKFGIYTITLNKKTVYTKLTEDKERVYNYVARLVLDQIPFEQAGDRINLLIDKSKSKKEIVEFNNYVIRQLKGRIDPSIPLFIEHKASHDHPGIQIADLFCWGIFRKYEKNDKQWFNVFEEKVLFDKVFL